MSLTLSQVDDAITKVLSGQSYQANGYTYTRANLGDLQTLRAQLQAEQGTSGNGRTMFARGRILRT